MSVSTCLSVYQSLTHVPASPAVKMVAMVDSCKAMGELLHGPTAMAMRERKKRRRRREMRNGRGKGRGSGRGRDDESVKEIQAAVAGVK